METIIYIEGKEINDDLNLNTKLKDGWKVKSITAQYVAIVAKMSICKVETIRGGFVIVLMKED